MVRNYVRKTDRLKWDEANMRKAIEAVISSEMGFFKAAKTFDVPRSTLIREVKKVRISSSENYLGKRSIGRFRSVFTRKQEEELAAHVKSMQEELTGITGKELRVLAFQFATDNNMSNRFNLEDGMAGQDWLEGFLKRHPYVANRRPELTLSGATLNKAAVDSFFDLLECVVEKHAITPDRIYNVNAIGISLKKSKILSLKDLTSVVREDLITALIAVNSTGKYAPPMLIFPRNRMEPGLLVGLPSRFWGTCNDNGWISSKRFLDWLANFVVFAEATKEEPILLLVDCHAAHTKSIELIEYARKHNVLMLCTPPHCTDKLQPLNVSFIQSLTTYYDAKVEEWQIGHSDEVLKSSEVADLLGKAYAETATVDAAVNGFEKSGIWPVDRNVLGEADFPSTEMVNTGNIVKESRKMANREDLSSFEPSTSKDSPRFDYEENVDTFDDCGVNLDEDCPEFKPDVSAIELMEHTVEPYTLTDIKVEDSFLISKEDTTKPIQALPTEDQAKFVSCLYCGDSYSETGEDWFACCCCGAWAHSACAEIDDD